MTTAQPSRARSARAEASGSSGSSTSASGAPALEASTPALAHTKPWRVRQISRPASARTSSAVSDRITSTWRGSLPCSAASARARSPGSTSASRTTRPSALETTLWAITSTSPARSSPAAASSAARSSPGRTSGRPGQRLERDHPAATPGSRRSEQLARAQGAARARGERRAQRREVVGRVDVEPERRDRGHPRRERPPRAPARRGGRTSPARTRARSRPAGGSSSALVPAPWRSGTITTPAVAAPAAR